MKKIITIVSALTVLIAATGYQISVANSNDNNNSSNVSQQEAKVIDSTSIKEKMLNAILYYEDVRGNFKHITPSRNIVVEFEVKENKSPYSNVKVKSKGQVIKESVADENAVVNIYPEEKVYNKIQKAPIDQNKLNKRTLSMSDKDGKALIKIKPDPATAQDAQIVTYPQQVAHWLDDTKENYKIIGNESFLDRDATVIEGALLDELTEKFNADRFKMWVDTETGVLLKLITTNDDGRETSVIEVQEIEFNKGINKKKNTNGPKGYKQM